MYRDIIAGLASWKDKADRQPAVVTGAVSVGKTTAVKESVSVSGSVNSEKSDWAVFPNTFL